MYASQAFERLSGGVPQRCISWNLEEYRQLTFQNIDEMDIPKVDEELERIAEQEISEELEQMLDCLSETDRGIFLKLYMEEKDLDEVSAETGLKKEVIYNRLSRGKKRIRSVYESREV